MNVLVTGATGFVGQDVLRELHAAGHFIRMLARHASSRRVQEIARDFGAEVHPGNVLDTSSLEAGLKGTEAVIHLVGIISEAGRDTFESVHTLGTQNVVAAAQRAGVARFVHMSALGTRPDAAARYHQSKWAAEQIVRRSGLAWTVFRPSIIFGPQDAFVNLFAKISRWSPVLPLMGSGGSRFQPVPVADVAICFVKALGEPRSIGGTYEVCGTEVLTLGQILDSILDVTGRKRAKLPVPWWLARCQAAILEFIFARLLGRPPPLNRDQLIMLQENNLGDPQPALELFGLKLVPFREGIARYLKRSQER